MPFIQFGASLSVQLAAVAFVLVSWPAQSPECPPATRARVIPASPPLVFQPLVSTSKPGLPTKLGSGGGGVMLSVTVTVPTSLPPRPSETV